MTRTTILLALLAAVVVACGGNQVSPSANADAEPDPTVAATETVEPTADATGEPAGSGDTGFEGDLADVIPDELNGVAGTEVAGMEQFLGPALAQQNIDPSEVQFVFTSYGQGDDAVMLNAIKVPGVTEANLDLLARSMAGIVGTGEVDVENLDVGGKSVLRVTGGAQPGAVYLYFTGGAAFTVTSENEDLAEQLISELP